MFKISKLLQFASSIFFILIHDGFTHPNSNQNGTDPLYFMNLLNKLDNFVNGFVNTSTEGGKLNCTNLVIVLGDTSEHAVKLVQEIVGEVNLTKTTNQMSILDTNLGLDITKSLQPNLICSNKTTTAFLTVVRYFQENITTLEEFITKNYFLTQIIRHHHFSSSDFKSISLLQLSNLKDAHYHGLWLDQIHREYMLGALFVMNISSFQNINQTLDPTTYNGMTHLFDENSFDHGHYSLRMMRSILFLRNNPAWLKNGDNAEFRDLMRQEFSRKDFTVGNWEHAHTWPEYLRLRSGSLEQPRVLPRSLAELTTEINEKVIIPIFQENSDCFYEELKSHRSSEFRPSSLRHCADTNYQTLLTMNAKLWSLSSPSAMNGLVDKTLTQILGRNETSQICAFSPEKYLQLETFGHFLNVTKYAEESLIILHYTWVIPYTQLVEHEKDSGTWYSFIHGLIHGLSSHSVQQRRTWFNVENPEDYGKPNKSQGIQITTENFPRFVDKFKFYGPEFYPKLKQVELTKNRLLQVNTILKKLLQDGLQISCENVTLTIQGNVICLSEILEMKYKHWSCLDSNFANLNIFATHTIYGDADVTALPNLYEGVNLTLIAPFVYWNPIQHCSLAAEYKSADVIWEFSIPNSFKRIQDASIISATCSGEEEMEEDKVSQIKTPRIILGKVINRFKLFARLNTLEGHFLNLSLLELLHSLESNGTVLDMYDCQGFADELDLLSHHPLYLNNFATDDWLYYLNALLNNTKSYLERQSMDLEDEGEGNNTKICIQQLQTRIGDLVSDIQLGGSNKSRQQLTAVKLHNPNEDKLHTFRNVAISLFSIGLTSCLIFGLFLAVKKYSDILENSRQYLNGLSNGFQRMRN